MPSNQLILLPSAPDISEAYSAANEEISRAILRAQENLLRQQKPDGHWCGELLVDSTLCSDYVVFMMAQKYFKQQGLGNQSDWNLAFEHGYEDGFNKTHPR